MAENKQNAESQGLDREFVTQKIYVKDISFEAPNSPVIFSSEYEPNFHQHLRNTTNKVSDNMYEVQLSITVTAKVGDKTAFLVEVQQAGLFVVSGYDEDELEKLLGVYCANLVFPYASETVANLVQRGGFPSFVLPVVNFDGLFDKYTRERTLKEQQPSDGQEV